VESAESNGKAEAFVETFKRDHVRVNLIPDATTAFAAVAVWLADYYTVRPGSRIGYRSPRECLRTRSQPAACAISRGQLQYPQPRFNQIRVLAGN
jgi:putative transposase